MGLYLAIFDSDKEIDGVEVGFYGDFGLFRDAVVKHVEDGLAGSRCPTLIVHSDCDGEWSPIKASALERELLEIERVFRSLPPTLPRDGWQPMLAKQMGLTLANLYDCFFDVDGEPLIERLATLVRKSQQLGLPILFQ